LVRPVFNEEAFLEPRLRAVDELLRARLSDPERLAEADAARIAKVSPGHLCRLFRQLVGATFMDWQHAVRTEEAKRLLLNRSLSLRRAAEAVGFAHYETFCRVFTRIEDLSPKQLRAFVREYTEFAPIVCSHTAGLVLRIALLARSNPRGVELLANVAELFLSLRHQNSSRRC
jgi:AraC-like DNA-binding protein